VIGIAAFELPSPEAADVEMVRVDTRIIPIPLKLNLDFKLFAIHKLITDHAVSAGAGSAPHTVLGTVG
jgi:hypothetical protein